MRFLANLIKSPWQLLWHRLRAEICWQDRLIVWGLVAFAVLQLGAAVWDLPGSYGWENDGVAPRDLFAGIAHNLTPGRGHNYPLFHFLILALLCWPFVLAAALGAESMSMAALTQAMLAVPIMTAISVMAKLLAIVMGCIALSTLGHIARRTVSRTAARWAVLCAATCLSVAYYGRTSNLDMPYLMWTVLAIHALLDVGERGHRRDYLRFACYTAAAVATKDQAYAAFVLVGPLYMLLLPLAWPRAFAACEKTPRQPGQARHWRHFALALPVGGITLAALGGALVNPTGFVARLEMLLGPNSRDWRSYGDGVSGLWANISDLSASQAVFWWPWPVVILCWLGVALTIYDPRSADDTSPHTASQNDDNDEAADTTREPLKQRLWRLLPLAAGGSSLLFFTLVVGRSDHRFALPLGFWLSYYGGFAAHILLHRPGTTRRILCPALAVLMAWAGGHTLQLHLTQWGDARHQVVDYLSQLPAGSTVETYGLTVYQPHFDVSGDAAYRVQRIGPKAVNKRNPLLGVREIQAPYGDIESRQPDILVITESFARRFLRPPPTSGRIQPAVVDRYRAGSDGEQFFTAVLNDELPHYRIVAVFAPKLPPWATALGARTIAVHGSTGQRIWLAARTESP